MRSGTRYEAALAARVHLLFDETRAGAVVIDDIGFSKMSKAFLEVSASR